MDEWHGTNVFYRDGDRVFRTYFINNRGDEQMGGTWNYLDITPLGRQEVWEDSPAGLSADPALQVVELARQLRRRRGARQDVGRGVGRRRGGVPEPEREHETMSEACSGNSGGQATRRNDAALRVADGLALAASPTFAIMALLTGVLGGGPADMLCSAASIAAERNGDHVSSDERLPRRPLAEAAPRDGQSTGLSGCSKGPPKPA